MAHNATKSVLYVSQHPADTVVEIRCGSIKLDFHTKVWGVKRRLDGTGHFEPFCLIMEIALLVLTASGPFCPQTNGQNDGRARPKTSRPGADRQLCSTIAAQTPILPSLIPIPPNPTDVQHIYYRRTT